MVAVVVLVVFVFLVALVKAYYVSKRPRLPQLPKRVVVASDKNAERKVVDAKQQRVCVIGGCGALGACLVRELVDDPDVVSITVLDLFLARQMEDPKVKYVRGDITVLKDVLSATRDAHIVFHVASLIDLRSQSYHWPRIWAVNVLGAYNVVEACVENGVLALVYTGSVSSRHTSVLYPDAGRTEINVDGSNNIFSFPADDCITLYGKSKNLAERYVVSSGHGRGVLRAACVLPCIVFGYDDVLQVARHAPNAAAGAPSPGIVDIEGTEKGFCSFSWNVSCARLHIQCAKELLKDTPGVSGSSFFQADFDMDHAEFHRKVDEAFSQASGGVWKVRNPLFRLIPRPIFWILHFATTAIDFVLDGNGRGDVFQLQSMGVFHYGMGNCSIKTDRAKKLLHFQPASPHTAFIESTAPYVRKMLKK